MKLHRRKRRVAKHVLLYAAICVTFHIAAVGVLVPASFHFGSPKRSYAKTSVDGRYSIIYHGLGWTRIRVLESDLVVAPRHYFVDHFCQLDWSKGIRDPDSIMWEEAQGFPFRSFKYHSEYDGTPHNALFLCSSVRGQLVIDWWAVPLQPIVKGVVLNTVVYLPVAVGLVHAPGALRWLRRHRRVSRGRCWKCGYDLRGLGHDEDKCPECGASIHRRVAHARP